MGGNGSKDESKLSLLMKRFKQRQLFFKSGKLAEVYLGKLRAEHHQHGLIFLDSDSEDESLSGFEKLCSVSTFVFTRLNEHTRDGFGFRCEISLKKGGRNSGHFIVSQIEKPKRGFIGKEDSSLVIHEISRETIISPIQKQVVEILFQKSTAEIEESDDIEGKIPNQLLFHGIEVNGPSEYLGEIGVKDDWTAAYELKNDSNIAVLIAERVKRLSGGIEFQVSSAQESDPDLCVATLVRLEEAKFILKVYVDISNENKALVISFVIFLIYRLSR